MASDPPEVAPWPRRDTALLVAAVVLAAAYFVRLGVVDVTEPDEVRYAVVARTMVESGDIVTPRINGCVYLDKPPLLHWLNALSMRALGFTAFAARLPSVLVGLATVAVAGWLAASIAGREAGLWTSVVLLSAAMPAGVSRLCRYDALFTLGVTAALACAWQALQHPGCLRWYAAAGVCTAAAILAKGPVALALVGGSLAVFALLARVRGPRRRRSSARTAGPPGAGPRAPLGGALWLTALAVTILLAAPWFVLAESRHPGYFHWFIANEHLARLHGATGELHAQPFWFLLPITFVGIAPWSLLLVPSITGAVRRARTSLVPRDPTLLLLCWAAVPVVLFSLSQGKLPTYVLPALPPLAVLVGCYLAGAVGATGSTLRRWLIATAGVSLALAAGAAAYVALGGPEAISTIAIQVIAAVAVLGLCGLVALVAALLRRPVPALLALAVLGLGEILVVFEAMPAFPVTEGPEAARVAAELARPGDLVMSWGVYNGALLWIRGGRMVVAGPFPNEYEYPENAAALDAWYYPPRIAGGAFRTRQRIVCVAPQRDLAWLQRNLKDRMVIERLVRTKAVLVIRGLPPGDPGLATPAPGSAGAAPPETN